MNRSKNDLAPTIPAKDRGIPAIIPEKNVPKKAIYMPLQKKLKKQEKEND